MIHFYMIVSGKPELEFQAEVFVRSLELFGKVDYCLTICQGPKDKLKSPLLKNRAEVIINDKEHWHWGLGCVPERGDVTIYTDADIMICDDLRPILTLCEGKVGGVIAFQSPRINWKSLFNACDLKWERLYKHYRGGECPYYVNLGFVSVPSKWIPRMNDAMIKFLHEIEKVYPGHYHKPQFAMSLAVESMKLPRIDLPVRWNVPDIFPEFFPKKPAVMHLLGTKSVVNQWSKVRSYESRTPPMKYVQTKLNYINQMIF